MARPGHRHRLTLDDLDEEALAAGPGLEDTLDSFDNTLCERDANGNGVAIDSGGVRLQASGEEIDDAVHRDELQILDDNIGRGACSQVQLAKSRTDGRLYALKIFNIFDGPKRRQLWTEVKSLWNVHCPALIGFYGAFLDGGRVCCVLEYMDCGTLEDVIYKVPGDLPIPENMLASLAYQMLWGLAFLQHDNQLHRDVKPGNVLVNRRGEAKLGDFGIARRLEENGLANTVTGTFKYMSPERLNGETYTYNSDVWSVGVLLLEAARKRYPFGDCHNQIELVQGLQESDTEDVIRSCDLSAAFGDFLRGCMVMDKRERLDAEQLLDSPVFAEYGIHDYDSAAKVLAAWVRDCVPERKLEYSDDYDSDAKMLNTLGSSMGTMDEEATERCLETYNSFRASDEEVGNLSLDMADMDLKEAKREYDSTYDRKLGESK
uniref:mitogen-activated protein kinase kinase n=1 Tax=Phaeomonas parva TaxID=124430 RepID=A0A7S1UEJ8_9STRA|mmetsp:Transcript_447/g.1159  ORF Transcript_447/g.1159 Transcript_447/m.1159 type:complete len:433 (+) Transcript_447:98-1396(+)|eukprot:CAMPEP_0118868522 /NCGR_PEP_ID=MMETSP1163-20130328/11971_1 /TAXON_ID=124430 /ORGANISM="Phaeomonas parva, Strain CCMP2877" /LENGTH=432 /DNA_ID=CAMNT_0006803219 /DNA_START=96 /DNA_END=1394 /DNA_ORIENTATION=-